MLGFRRCADPNTLAAVYGLWCPERVTESGRAGNFISDTFKVTYLGRHTRPRSQVCFFGNCRFPARVPDLHFRTHRKMRISVLELQVRPMLMYLPGWVLVGDTAGLLLASSATLRVPLHRVTTRLLSFLPYQARSGLLALGAQNPSHRGRHPFKAPVMHRN